MMFFRWACYSKKKVSAQEIAKHITIVRKATPQEKKWTCFNYAMHQATGNTARLNIYHNLPYNNSLSFLSIDIEKFFQQTENPKHKDLVIYTSHSLNHRIHHFAVVIDEKTFESKWGASHRIIQHELFDIPTDYGDTASFWTLKEEYTTPNGKKILLETIQQDADQFNAEHLQNFGY